MISSAYYSHYSKDSDLSGCFLHDHSAHIWQVSLTYAKDEEESFELLSQKEQARGDRYLHETDRYQFRMGRKILRILLGHYLCLHPADVRFKYGEYGKPFVEGIQFSLAHSKDEIVYIFTRYKPVGIDIEYIRHDIDIDGIAKRFFAEHQYPENVTDFFNTWVEKEAMIKATGEGLFTELKTVEVKMPWVLHRFFPAPGYAGAWVIKDEN